MSALPDQQSDAFSQPIPIPSGVPVELRVEIDFERLHFAYRLEGQGRWTLLPTQFDASILSDEAGPVTNPNFTGAFVGMCCQDMSGARRPAGFDYFLYRERQFVADPKLLH